MQECIRKIVSKVAVSIYTWHLLDSESECFLKWGALGHSLVLALHFPNE